MDKILFIKNKIFDESLATDDVCIKKRLMPWHKYFYKTMFVSQKDKEKLLKQGKSKYNIFDNKLEANLNLYLKLNKEKLINKDFSLISNDCWGAYVYTYLDIRYSSPFIWLYLSSSDFMKLAKDFKKYMECELKFIDSDMSFPVGMLGDIKLNFNHYKTEDEARSCFEKRKERINYNNLYFRMFSENEEEITSFKEIPHKNKVMFFNKEKYFKASLDKNIILMQSTPEYLSFGQYAQLQSYKYFDIIEWLNSGNVVLTNIDKNTGN